ncbi:MAG: flagellum-specific ATP synthase FliI [Rubricella sp.]
MNAFARLEAALHGVEIAAPGGQVTSIRPDRAVVRGLQGRIGDTVGFSGGSVGEVVALEGQDAIVMPLGRFDEVTPGMRAIRRHGGAAPIGEALLGRVIDGFGTPLDGAPILHRSHTLQEWPDETASPLDPGFGARLRTGYSVIDTLMPLVEGQRLGLFAGSGVGKTTLLRGLAAGTDADIVVLALVGERRREIGAFLDALGAEARARSVAVAATADTSPLEKRRALDTAAALARTHAITGRKVLLIVDSITRYAEACRDIAVALGEPMGRGGWPVSVTTGLARIFEQAGRFAGGGSVTAVHSVLVAGSDHDEPLADTVRGLLDGHIVLDRTIAERGQYPAIDIPRSVSRALPDAASTEENRIIAEARRTFATLARITPIAEAGLLEPGADPIADAILAGRAGLEGFASSRSDSIEAAFEALSHVLATLELPGR